MRLCVPFSAFPKEKSVDGERERVAFILKPLLSGVHVFLWCWGKQILHTPAQKKNLDLCSVKFLVLKFVFHPPRLLFLSSQTWLNSKYDIAHCPFLKQVPFLPFYLPK